MESWSPGCFNYFEPRNSSTSSEALPNLHWCFECIGKICRPQWNLGTSKTARLPASTAQFQNNHEVSRNSNKHRWRNLLCRLSKNLQNTPRGGEPGMIAIERICALRNRRDFDVGRPYQGHERQARHSDDRPTGPQPGTDHYPLGRGSCRNQLYPRRQLHAGIESTPRWTG